MEDIGETDRALKERGYEHRLVTRKDMKRSHSIEETKENEEQEDTSSLRRSRRGKGRVNYKDLNSGKGQYITEGSTAVSAHIATEEHEEGDVTIEVIGIERNTWKRKIKEALRIKEIKPNLNIDEGRYLSAIYETIEEKYGRKNNQSETEEQTTNNVARRNSSS